nr:hypothetical protein CFP56_75398 [Quercus suber]
MPIGGCLGLVCCVHRPWQRAHGDVVLALAAACPCLSCVPMRGCLGLGCYMPIPWLPCSQILSDFPKNEGFLEKEVSWAWQGAQGHARMHAMPHRPAALASHPRGMPRPRRDATAPSGSVHARALAACPQGSCYLRLGACQLAHALRRVIVGYVWWCCGLAYVIACELWQGCMAWQALCSCIELSGVLPISFVSSVARMQFGSLFCIPALKALVPLVDSFLVDALRGTSAGPRSRPRVPCVPRGLRVADVDHEGVLVASDAEHHVGSGLPAPFANVPSERHHSAPHDLRARLRPSLPSGEPGPPGIADIDEECYLLKGSGFAAKKLKEVDFVDPRREGKMKEKESCWRRKNTKTHHHRSRNPPHRSPTQPCHHADQRDEEDDDCLCCISIGLMRVQRRVKGYFLVVTGSDVHINPLSMDILVEAQINQPDFGRYNLKRSPLHCKLIYLIPVGFFDLFASKRTV